MFAVDVDVFDADVAVEHTQPEALVEQVVGCPRKVIPLNQLRFWLELRLALKVSLRVSLEVSLRLTSEGSLRLDTSALTFELMLEAVSPLLFSAGVGVAADADMLALVLLALTFEVVFVSFPFTALGELLLLLFVNVGVGTGDGADAFVVSLRLDTRLLTLVSFA